MKFFAKQIKEGMPISTPGFSAGVMKMAHALERLSIDGGYVSWTADGIPKIIINQGASTQILAFEAVAEYADYLMCAKVAYLDFEQGVIPVTVATGETEKLFKVWKPWILRRTPFDGVTIGGITYAYDYTEYTTDYTFLSTKKRRATKDENGFKEFQEITPSYTLRTGTAHGGLIHAIADIKRVSTEGGTAAKVSGEFIDINADGKCWAAGKAVWE